MKYQAPEMVEFAASDGYRFAVRRWQPDTAKAHVILLHGIISHSGWYLQTSSHLAEHGFAVSALDRRGSGQNQSRRGDAVSCDRLVQDVREYLAALPDEKPVILLGVSWGGLLATKVARCDGRRIVGLGLLCPGFYSRKGASRLQNFGVQLANRIGLGGFTATIPLQDPKLFTDSPKWQGYIRDDPFTLRRVTLRMAQASAVLYQDVLRHPGEVNTPTLLMLAENDRITLNDRVRELVSQFATSEQTIIEYAGAAHTLEFEPNVERYLDDLTAWCRARSQSI